MKTLPTLLICIILSAGVLAQDSVSLSANLPLRSLSVTSPFGFRIHPVTGRYAFHAGVDLRAHCDTVFAVLKGTTEVGYDHNLGIYLIINQGRLQIIYGHLSRILVSTGDLVSSAVPLAITGATGRVTGEHLHFSVRYCGQYIDPLLFLNALMRIRRFP